LEITWDLIGQTILFAALVAIVLGTGKVIATALLTRRHFRRKQLSKEEKRKIQDLAAPEIVDAIVEIVVGFAIMVGFIVSGVLDETSTLVMIEFTTMLGAIILILVVVYWYTSKARNSLI